MKNMLKDIKNLIMREVEDRKDSRCSFKNKKYYIYGVPGWLLFSAQDRISGI